MSNNKNCSKCKIRHWDLQTEVNHSSLSGCEHWNIFKKNQKYFCFNCLASEYPVKCRSCNKQINSKDELGSWSGSTVHRGDCSSDPDSFSFYCQSHSKEKENPKLTEARSEIEGQEIGSFGRAHDKAQNYWNSLSSSERERECERLFENMKLGKYWATYVAEGSSFTCAYGDGSCWTVKNGKLTSDYPHLVPIQLVEEFEKKELGTCDGSKVELGLIKSRRVKDNPPLEIENKEEIGEKKIEIVDNNKSNNEVLTIDLERIKKITLRGNNKLEIEFNSVQKVQNVSHYYSVNQVLSDEQVDSNQLLREISNYLQKTGKDGLNHQELAEFFTSSSIPTETPKDTNKFLWIGAPVLVFGLLIWLLVLSKRKWKKH
jgi:hypothetical protein